MAKILEYISLNYTWFLVGAIIIVLAIIGHYAEKTNFGQGKSNNTSPEDEDKKLDLEKVTLTDLISKDNKNLKNNGLENINAQEIFNENSLEDVPSNSVKDNFIIQEQTGINNSGQNDLSQFDNLPNQTVISNNIVNPEVVTNDSNNNNVNNDDMQEIDADLFGSIESVQPIVTESDSIDEINSNNIEKSDISTDEVSDESQSVNDLDLPKNEKEKFENFDEQFESIIPKKEVINGDLIDSIDDLSLEQTQAFDTEDIPELDDVDLPEIRDINISDNDIWKF